MCQPGTAQAKSYFKIGRLVAHLARQCLSGDFVGQWNCQFLLKKPLVWRPCPGRLLCHPRGRKIGAPRQNCFPRRFAFDDKTRLRQGITGPPAVNPGAADLDAEGIRLDIQLHPERLVFPAAGQIAPYSQLLALTLPQSHEAEISNPVHTGAAATVGVTMTSLNSQAV